mgnify:CR=1 FL=1
MSDLVLKNICYRYPKTKHMVLNEINFTFRKGTVTSIRGQSGAGKSTLLYLIAGIDYPTSGQLLWDDTPVKDLSDYRRNVVSIISQSYLLFPTRTVFENVCYPLILEKKLRSEVTERATQLLQSVGIGVKLYDRLPEKLSGGEQQRVAIARCLASNSKIIAADEPTGNLDEENTQVVIRLLQKLAHENEKTVILVTHDPVVAQMADEQLQLIAGNLINGGK